MLYCLNVLPRQQNDLRSEETQISGGDIYVLKEVDFKVMPGTYVSKLKDNIITFTPNSW